MIAMGAVAIVMLFVESRASISTRKAGSVRPPGVERGHHAGETAFKRRQPALRRALSRRVRKPGQRLLVRQPIRLSASMTSRPSAS